MGGVFCLYLQKNVTLTLKSFPNLMYFLLEILNYSIGSIFWGLIIGIVCLVLFFSLIKGWYKSATFSPVSYLVGAILGVLLIAQCILICGACAIISATNDYEQSLTEIIRSFVGLTNEIVTPEESQVIIDQLIGANPLVADYIGGGEFTGYTAVQLPGAICEELRSYMRWYIVRRILWSLGFVIVAAIIVIKSLKQIKYNDSSFDDFTQFNDFNNNGITF